MKKSVLIVVSVGLVLALVLIGIFGVRPFLLDQTVFVESVEIQGADEEGRIFVDYDNNTTVQLEWEVKPYEATDKSVTFTSNDPEEVTVSETGLVTLNSFTGAEITVTANDGSGKAHTIRVLPTTTAAVSVGYDFATNSVEAGTNYTVDAGKLVLYNGRNYTFDFATINAELLNETDAVSVDGNKFSTLATGEFTIRFTKGDEVKELNVEVVDSILALGIAADGGYQKYLNATSATNTVFTDKTKIYEIGAGSTFKTQLSITNMKGDYISEFEKVITLEEYVEGEYVAVVDASVYVTETEDNKAYLNFTEAAVGKQFRIKIASKYQANRFVTLVFKVNDGINVHNHQELVVAYEDTAINRINIHGTIVAVADPLKNIYTDVEGLNGYLINEFINEHGLGRTNIGTDSNKTGNIYLRKGTTDLEIVGNYQFIDGSGLPKIRNHTGKSDLLPDDTHCAVQTALFRFGHYKDAGNGGLTIKNLQIIGNTQRSDNTYDSGAVNLLYFSSLGDSYVENINLSKGVIGLFLNDNVPTVHAKDLKITETYNSGVFSWTGKLNITNTIMANNGGPAIQMVDANKLFNSEGVTANDPVLWIDEYTLNHINNWVTGQEGWFVGNNVTTAATALKTQVNGFTTLHYNNSLYKEVDDVSVINLKLMLMNDNPVYSERYPDPQGQIYITSSTGQITLARGHDFASTKIYSDNSYIAPVTEAEGFEAIYDKYMQAWGTEVYIQKTYHGKTEQQAHMLAVPVARNALTVDELAIWDAQAANTVNVEVVTEAGMTSQITMIAEWIHPEP